MSLHRLLIVLGARWRLAAAVMLSVLGMAVAVSLALPNKYKATASVVLDVKSPDPIAGVLLPGMTVSGYMGTQIEVISSERVALKAIKALGLDNRPGMRDAWQQSTGAQGDYLAWLAEGVQARLEAKPAKDSNVINITYLATQADEAAEMANALMQAYIDTTLELRVEPARQYNNFFDERARQLRDTLAAAQHKLSAFQRESGIVNADERLDTENTRLTELSAQLVALQAVSEESRTRMSAARNNAQQMPEVLASPLLIALTTDLSRQETRLDEIRERLGDAHPSVHQAVAGIAQLRQRIDAERARVTGSVGINSDVDRTRVSQLKLLIQEQQSRLMGLKQSRDELNVLKRDVENAQRGYDAVYSRINQSAMESQMTQTNVSTLKRATPPRQPASPRLLLNTLAGAVLGALLALGVVVIRELADTRLRTADDVVLALGQHSLGTLPTGRRAAQPRLARNSWAVAPTARGLPWQAK